MNRQLYYQLIALWVVCEAMLGGIIHGLKIPVSGLIVGSCAVICISLIAWYIPQKGVILKATLIVAIFKMMLSPQAPPPAYLAVLFQGLMGELLFFRHRKFYRLSCMLLAVLALIESGLQRILVLTIVYGNDLWKVVNNFINGLTNQSFPANYSLLLGIAYVLLHLLTGLWAGWWASTLPKRIAAWSKNDAYRINLNEPIAALPAANKKKKRIKKGLVIAWIILTGLYIQSYYAIGKPLLPSTIVLKIMLRSFIIVLSWIIIISPLIKLVLHRWLQKEKTRSQQEINEVVRLLPAMQQLLTQSWKSVATYKGWNKIKTAVKIILVNTLNKNPEPFPISADFHPALVILTGPVQSGKTTALLNWSNKRKDVYGIFTPVVNGKRVFMDAFSKKQFQMEAGPGEKDVLSIGRFTFSKKGFENASNIIREAVENKGWLVIDEIGPLELKGEGFSVVLKELVKSKRNKVLLVVRDNNNMVKQVENLLDKRPVIICGHEELSRLR